MTADTEWALVAAACKRVGGRLNALTSRIVHAIGEQVPAYGEAAVTAEDHRDAVAEHQRIVLRAIAERRPPDDADLAFARELGRRRALQGLPLYALIQAYHVAYQELWEVLLAETEDPCNGVPGVMATAAGRVWDAVQTISAAVAEAHEESARARDLLEQRVRRSFIERLVASDAPSELVFDVARSLGFDPDGGFQALCISATGVDGARLERLESAVRHVGTGRCLVRGGEPIILLWQGARSFEVQTVVARVVPGHPAGIGARRMGLGGARLSIGDAERALAIARRRGVDTVFEDEWLACLAAQGEERLAVVLEAGMRVADTHPDFHRTVVVFARSRFSLAETARVLHLHPNTAAYRLARWRELTGWDPRDFGGLAKAMACEALAHDRPRSRSRATTSRRISDVPS